MESGQVDQALRTKFVDEAERILFWHDQDGEFSDYVESGLPTELDDVTVIRLPETGGLSAKLLLDRQDPDGKYLIYEQGKRLPPEEDWLLDIRAYSEAFHADVASVWLTELGLNALSLRGHLKERSVFMGNKERRRALSNLTTGTDDAAAIDLKMMAVVARTDVPQLFSVIRALCHGHLEGRKISLGAEPEALKTFEKMGLLDPFWGLVERDFGYAADAPTFAGLLRSLFVTELLQQLGSPVAALAHFELPAASRQNAAVCLTQWRDSATRAKSYDAASEAVASELGIAGLLEPLPLDSLRRVFTFWTAEKQVVSALKNRVRDEAHATTPDWVQEVVTERMAGHWLHGPGRDEEAPRSIADSYAAIVAAAELFALRATHAVGFSYDTPQALLDDYCHELFRFDQLYRVFSARAAAARSSGWDLLKELAADVEDLYDQTFLQKLGLEWGRHLDDGFLDAWSVPGMRAQLQFFDGTLRPYLDESDRRRAYVIISDAFRYEAADELCGLLNGRYRMNAELEPMLGVLPSYTSLGMASLLPHETLSYSDNGHVLADGASTAGLKARNDCLDAEEGMACRAEELLAMKTDEARAFTRGKRVVYIYHNVIDARGDSAATESETFAAVDDCITELVDLVHFCVSRLNAATVRVTADHGFLFQQQEPGGTDRSVLTQKPDSAVKSTKRFVLGRALGTAPNVHRGSTAVTAGTDDPMEFWLPRGANRFNFVGGARFFHGGAMPQEVIVPLLTVKQLRGASAEASKTEKVSIQLLGTHHKITTPRHRFEFIQTAAVSDRRKPLTVKVAVYEGATPVTSVETVVFDSASDSMQDRERSVRLDLLSRKFDKRTAYQLILRDAESDAQIQAHPVIIDRSFESDF